MGAGLTETDVVRLVGTVGSLLMYELLRTGASVGELRRAIAIAASGRAPMRKLSPRMRRLVDLVSAVGQGRHRRLRSVAPEISGA
jgi:hypothetical protein